MIHVKDFPPPENFYPVRRALLSVYDKSGLADFARRLHELGVQLLSTGGTAKAIRESGLPVTDVSELTGFPEILNGRVKTLHPAVHAGLLARRTDPEDVAQLDALAIEPIDLAVVNLYPFSKATAHMDVTDAIAVENIDIGGPTMIRAAAKNFFYVGVVTVPTDYDSVADELAANEGRLSMTTRRRLAHTAFQHTAEYDQAISSYFERAGVPADSATASVLPPVFTLSLPQVQSMRYGENPAQSAALYGDPFRYFDKLHGKPLSFNNLMDLNAALFLIDEFEEDGPTCAILKHTNPCGIAVAQTLVEAYERAFATDRQSPFGGIICVNKPLDLATAKAIDRIFTEIIIAPAYEDGVLDLLMKKKNRRLIKSLIPAESDMSFDVRSVLGGLLVQERDPVLPSFDKAREQYRVVTQRIPTEAEWLDLYFAWRVVKFVKSNAIVYAKDRATLGIGAGQMSRIDSSEIAVMKGKKSELDFNGSVVASDAFFPFADGLVAAATTGARAAIQPGGSIRDNEVIRAANEHGMAMVFTERRHFRH